jgi:hypothetical protein
MAGPDLDNPFAAAGRRQVLRAGAPAPLARCILPLYLGLFQFVHNARRRGKALLGALVALLVT